MGVSGEFKAQRGIGQTLVMATALIVFHLLGSGAEAQAQIDIQHWGRVTAPVFGLLEQGAFAGADLFAGPRKFGPNYYAGVLPNGRIVRPAGISIPIGMNPLGAALTPDGKYLVTSNDDDRNSDQESLQQTGTHGGHGLSVIETATMKVVSQGNLGRFFVGLQISGTGPYRVWASSGPDNRIRLFRLSTTGELVADTPSGVPITPLLSATEGYVSHYVPDAHFDAVDNQGNKPSVPSSFDRKLGAQITYPAGSALSPDAKYLYVACNGDNSLAVIDTVTLKVVQRVPVGYFPYSVSVSRDGSKILVSNWGITEYRFKNPTYDSATGRLTDLTPTGANLPDGFYVPVTSTEGNNPKTSSVSILVAPGGNGARAHLVGALYQGKPLDALRQVGDTHPSATAIVRRGDLEVLYVTKSNDDSLGRIRLDSVSALPDFDLSPVAVTLRDGHRVRGAYPNALAVSPDGARLYVAEAGINSVAVLDTTDPLFPRLLGRIPTGWYPTALALGDDGRTLYVVNAKGIGEDANPPADLRAAPPSTGVESFKDANFVFGTVQKVDLTRWKPENSTVLAYNYALHRPGNTTIVPLGGRASQKIKHVFFILHENKSFDSMLGNLNTHFGVFAGSTFRNRDGSVFTDRQNTGVSLNTQRLATRFATAVNYYSDSEESDAGHQFASSGTASDYTEKTLNVKDGRGLLVNKNMEPEDYPAGGYIFNNAARHGVSFKDYGDLIRITGTDTGSSTPTKRNDPPSGKAGYPQLQPGTNDIGAPLTNAGDTDSPTSGLGQSYFLALPILAVLGENNPNGEPRLDRNYPGYNFNISDQRRALEFCKDFDRMVTQKTLPQFLHIYQPNDHGGGIIAPNKKEAGGTFLQQVGDGDVALGMVVQHIMKSPVYYNAATGEGSVIFISYDDAQSSLDHIHPHRTPLIAVSPYAKPSYLARKHYVTASIVKTEELLLGLPPNNYGDLFATDLRDLFQPRYNGITAANLLFSRTCRYIPTPAGKRIWALVQRLDTSSPDCDSSRLGRLARLSARADQLYRATAKRRRLKTRAYRTAQARLYQTALQLVGQPTRRDTDD